APTLFESRIDDFCELIISVISREDLRIERIIKRDSISRESAQNRINSQLKEEFFRNNSDFIIKNNGDVENLFEVAKEVSDKVKDYYYNKYV
ncbi:MAG: dephospho-CoA kinase, partial [Oscillospiraceae bacterium]|nr:dephospho-CoA kinase [Oscillospiraceae bacterium]